MEIKTVNRNIPSARENCNDKFRVKYNDKRAFQLLIVNIMRIHTGETQSFSFKAQSLPDKDSIHFSTSIRNNKLIVTWIGVMPAAEKKLLESKLTGPVTIVKSKSSEKKKPVITKDTIKSGFPPLVYPDSTVLILGTMPGELSLAKQEYYAHPRNLTWKIISTLMKVPVPEDYKQKKALLKKAHIALWDVCDICIRKGSLDAKITDEVPNDLITFLKKHKAIKTIAFNGGKAESLFEKYFQRVHNYNYLILPSSSPANAGVSWSQKLNFWAKIL
ncbi:MAG: DNA-deoxyinosine glycosylase [Bacteroidota bacterium]